jgi:hypothetical protein
VTLENRPGAREHGGDGLGLGHGPQGTARRRFASERSHAVTDRRDEERERTDREREAKERERRSDELREAWRRNHPREGEEDGLDRPRKDRRA